MAFCKFRVMDRCKKNNLPCTFNEECFTPEEEPEKIVMNCLKCHYRHPDNGNCTAVGGFCTSVPAAYCPMIPELLARAEKAERERNTAVEDLRQMCIGSNTCAFCAESRTECKRQGPNRKTVEMCWRWRGHVEVDEPIPMACIKMSGAILQGPADGCLVDVGEFGLLMADIKEESLVNAIYDEMQRRGVRETCIVSPDFVREAIREKLEREREQHEETAEKAQGGGGPAGADGL